MTSTIIKAADNTNASGALIGLAGWAASVNWIGWAGVLIALAGFWAHLEDVMHAAP